MHVTENPYLCPIPQHSAQRLSRGQGQHKTFCWACYLKFFNVKCAMIIMIMDSLTFKWPYKNVLLCFLKCIQAHPVLLFHTGVNILDALIIWISPVTTKLPPPCHFSILYSMWMEDTSSKTHYHFCEYTGGLLLLF